jgi:signal transduction histidine kinase
VSDPVMIVDSDVRPGEGSDDQPPAPPGMSGELERRRLVELFDQTPAFLAILRGPDHVFERVNGAYQRIVGFRDLIGQRMVDALPELSEQGFVAQLDRVLASGHAYTGTGVRLSLRRSPSAELEDRYLDFVYQPIIESDGTTSGILVHGIDVTDRVRAAAIQEESERRLRDQFEHIPVPTFLWRLEGETFVLADYNAAAMKASRGFVRDALGLSVREFYPAVVGLKDDMFASLRGQTVIRRDVEHVTPGQDDSRTLSLTIGPLQPDRVIVHSQDTTEQRQLELQFRQSQKMEAVGRLAGGVAHDFNNLLTVIRGHAEFMRRGEPGSSAWLEDLDELLIAVNRASELTRQLLAYSRKQVLQPRVLDMSAIINGLSAMVRRLIGEDITIDLRLANDLGEVRADQGQMEQVLVNLVLNSRDAMPMGGQLVIQTANVELSTAMRVEELNLPAGPYVTVSVSDTGCGMDAATRAHVFEPFFTTKEVGKGTGLGLSTVYGIITQSDGGVALESEPGKGTTVSVYLPRVVPPPEEPMNAWSEMRA